jgi:hypothetical protein
MNIFSVLGSFSRATQGNEEIIYDDLSETDGTRSSGGFVAYHDPGMANSILAPDACFNFK